MVPTSSQVKKKQVSIEFFVYYVIRKKKKKKKKNLALFRFSFSFISFIFLRRVRLIDDIDRQLYGFTPNVEAPET